MTGEIGFAVSVHSMGLALKEAGMLLTIDKTRGFQQTRKVIEGKQTDVWHSSLTKINEGEPLPTDSEAEAKAEPPEWLVGRLARIVGNPKPSTCAEENKNGGEDEL